MAFTYLPYDRQVNRQGYLHQLTGVCAGRGIAFPSGGLEPEHEWDSFGMDSLDYIDLINAVDDEFNCEIPPIDAAKFATVNDMLNWLEEKDCGPFEFPDNSESFKPYKKQKGL